LYGKGAWNIIEKFSEKVQSIFLICGEAYEDIINQLPKNVQIIQLKDFFKDKTESILRFEVGIKKACNKIIQEINF
jgi:hypothetical protein